jgi:hypothetical protein
VYSLRWLHRAEPPDFELVLLQDDPELWERWANAASLTLLAELRGGRVKRSTGPQWGASCRYSTRSKPHAEPRARHRHGEVSLMAYRVATQLEKNRERVAEYFLAQFGFEVYLPRVRHHWIRYHRRIEVLRPYFPGLRLSEAPARLDRFTAVRYSHLYLSKLAIT